MNALEFVTELIGICITCQPRHAAFIGLELLVPRLQLRRQLQQPVWLAGGLAHESGVLKLGDQAGEQHSVLWCAVRMS